MSRRKHASPFVLAAICLGLPAGTTLGGTVTYAFNDIAGPVDLPTTTTPGTFSRIGAGDGYSFRTYGSAYLAGSGVSVSSWTRVEIDLSSFASQTVESALLTLHVRDSIGPQDLTVWSDDGGALGAIAATSSVYSAKLLTAGVNTLDLTSVLQSRLDSGQSGLGLWFYNFYPAQTSHVVATGLGSGDPSPSTFTVNSTAAVPLPSSAAAGLSMLSLLGIGRLILRGRPARFA